MPREVYFYNFTSSDGNYLPLAPISDTTPQLSQSLIYNLQVLPLYNQKKEQVGFITWNGQLRKNPLLDNGASKNINIGYETGIIYITNGNSLNQDKILGSLSYSYTFLSDDVSGLAYRKGDRVTSSPTSVSGKYLNKKNITVKNEIIDTVKNKYKVVIVYDN